jgi:hypothetical protein
MMTKVPCSTCYPAIIGVLAQIPAEDTTRPQLRADTDGRLSETYDAAGG